VRFPLLQIAQVLLGGLAGGVSGQPCQVREHPGRSLLFEPREDCGEPVGWQSASCGSHGFADVTDGTGRRRKSENAHRIPTMAVDDSLHPLRPSWHRAQRGRPF
jgi:hypothetical protein